MRLRRQVVRHFPDKGFGFLEVAGEDEDIFFHDRGVPASVESLGVGTWLEFEIKAVKGKLRAQRISIPGAAVRRASAESEQRDFEGSGSTMVLAFAVAEVATLVSKLIWGQSILAGIVLGVFVVMNGVAAWQFRDDKARAGANEWRISEGSLLQTCLLGGWPTAWAMMRRHRHKIRKVSFLSGYALVVMVHLLGVAVFVAFG